MSRMSFVQAIALSGMLVITPINVRADEGPINGKDRSDLKSKEQREAERLTAERKKAEEELKRMNEDLERLRKAIEATRKRPQKLLESYGRREEYGLMRPPRVDPPVSGTIREVAGNRLTFTLSEKRGLQVGEKIVAYRFEPSSVTYGAVVIELVRGKELIGKLEAAPKEPMPEKDDVLLFDLQCGR